MVTTETITDKIEGCPFCSSYNTMKLPRTMIQGKMKALCHDCGQSFFIQYCPECGGTTTLGGAYSFVLDEGYSGFRCNDPLCNWDDIS